MTMQCNAMQYQLKFEIEFMFAVSCLKNGLELSHTSFTFEKYFLKLHNRMKFHIRNSNRIQNGIVHISFFCSDSDSNWHTIAKTFVHIAYQAKSKNHIYEIQSATTNINRRPSLFHRKTKLCVVRWCYKSDSRLYAIVVFQFYSVLNWELLLIVQSNQPVSHWLCFFSSSNLCAHQILIKKNLFGGKMRIKYRVSNADVYVGPISRMPDYLFVRKFKNF